MSASDPGFPVAGGGGAADLRHGHFSAEMYAKRKELGLVGGRGVTLPSRSATACYIFRVT